MVIIIHNIIDKERYNIWYGSNIFMFLDDIHNIIVIAKFIIKFIIEKIIIIDFSHGVTMYTILYKFYL